MKLLKVLGTALITGVFCCCDVYAQPSPRQDILLNDHWATVADDSNINAYADFVKPGFNDTSWKQVDVPHNWDAYEGYRRMQHGNRHGYAWYRKTLNITTKDPHKRYFLWFEGAGSYATVWLNGKQVGYHAGGRTSFTLDITETVQAGTNQLCVRTDHPAGIQDLPWVCGGCSEEVGFSEGSQPMGIFRPVHLIITEAIRIEPFGIHVWNDTTISAKAASLNIETELRNYGALSRTIILMNSIIDAAGNTIIKVKEKRKLVPGSTAVIRQQTPVIANPHLWSLEDPYLYKVVSTITEKGKVIDQITTSYGIRWIHWDVNKPGASNRFFLNGKPVFINGTAEYEHMMGNSHAFSDQQVKTRVMQVKAAGYNAFRDAHQPHNLRYQHYWDSLGLLWWTQHTAHIWFDTPAFRENFKTLLKEWVKERRNSPSLILWGLQNESHLPEDFARECSELIRQLDPTASSQRKVTTCNGGEGTDWDVPQNWTGTYGGNPATYAEDVKRQVLIGEYGAWRSLDFHTEGPFDAKGGNSEDNMTQLMEMKVRLAESVRDQSSGQFHWLLTSHENPGRVQGGEGLRELDRIGPVNYKGLFTAWGEPTDAFYMFRANYVPGHKEPMVYIVSHTWADRWKTPGRKDSIIVYSNCDEVELFNDVGNQSLGRKKNPGIGRHFQWDDVMIRHNVLYAVGYVKGKAVARDHIVMNHLPTAPHLSALTHNDRTILSALPNLHYIYRVNCGGPAYTDEYGNLWNADTHKEGSDTWGSLSWTDAFPGMPSFYASQRRTHEAVTNSTASTLFQNFRYGMDQLRYEFPLPDGEYAVELYFTEPWYGAGGGMNCTGWRVFDIAVNNELVIKDLDIWKEVGYNTVLKEIVKARSRNGMLSITFPGISSGQAVISAIAIASAESGIKPASAASPFYDLALSSVDISQNTKWSVHSWLDTGDKVYTDDTVTFSMLPPALYGASWIQTSRKADLEGASFRTSVPVDVYIGVDSHIPEVPLWLKNYEDTQTFLESDYGGGHRYKLLRKRFLVGESITLGNNDSVLKEKALMYTIAVCPVTSMEPAVDLRPVTTYKAASAHISEKAIARDTVFNRECIVFRQPIGGSIEWDMSVGVANVYAVRFRYFNESAQVKTLNLKILAADGSMLKEEILQFNPVKESKWKTVATSTETMINAGHYRIVLTALDAAGLAIRDLEIQ